MPRPVNRPVECWQPIVSAQRRAALDFMVKHGIKGVVGGGAATMAEGPIQAYRDAARTRRARTSKLGENLSVGIFFYLADSREQAHPRDHAVLRGAREDVRARSASCRASRRRRSAAAARRGGWKAAGVPTLDHYMKLGSWFAGTPAAADRAPEEARGALSRAWSTSTCRTSLGTPKAVMLEQFQRVAEEVMPAFR